MNKKIVIIALVFVLIITSAVSYLVTRESLTDKEISAKVPNPQERIKHELVIIENNVKLREKPEQSSFDIENLDIGDRVEVIAKTQEKAKIFDNEDYWYNIKYKNQTGWVFGAHLNGENSMDDIIYSKYKDYLTTLFENDPNSISDAIDTYKKYALLAESINAKDEMFRKFRTYYNKALSRQQFSESEQMELLNTYKRSRDIGRLNAGKGIKDENLIHKIEVLRKNGFVIEYEKEKFYTSEDSDFLLYNFSDISEALKEFLFIRGKELAEGGFDSSKVIANWDRVGETIMLWESYIERNPTYVEAVEAKSRINTYYVPLYLGLIDGTSAIDENTKRFSNQLIKSYKTFITNNIGSSYWELIRGYYELLEKTGFIYNEEVESYLKEKAIRKN